MSVYTVLLRDLDSLTKKINHITKKCDKAGIGYTYSVGEPYEHVNIRRDGEDEKVYSFTLVDIELDVKFHYNGWNVLGSVSRKDGILQCYFKDAELIKQYKDTDFHCDHCHKNAYRNSVIVLENDSGVRKIVGTSCLKEFTCGLDGNLVAAFVDVKKYLDYLVEITEPIFKDDSDDDDGFFEHYGSRGYSAFEILTMSSYVINYDGYIPAHELNATWKTVYRNYNNHVFRHNNDSDEEAEEAIDWIKGLSEDEYTESSYLFNLRQIVDLGYCTYRQFSLVVSLIYSYRKHKSKQILESVSQKPSEYVGNVGDKLSLNVILLKTICYESCYGTGYFHLFTDENCNVFKWSTNKALLTDDYHSIDEGTRLSLTGTVKSHDEYRGVKQTVITRCKYSVIQDNEPEEYPEGTWDDSVLDCICV